MVDVVLVESVRSPVGKRNGGLAHLPAPDLLGDVLSTVLTRAGVESHTVGQVVGGCVNQVGQQGGNVIRNAWLGAGLDISVGASTVHAQCGSAQQAFTLAYGMVAGGIIESAIACGIEAMSQVPINATVLPEYGASRSERYQQHFEVTTQFQAADRIASAWGLTREDLDNFAVSSQQRAASALAAGRFAGQIVPISVPTGIVATDEGPRATTHAGLAALKPNRNGDIDALHTAGTSSQISDGAAAVLMMAAPRAERLGVQAQARVVDSLLVGTAPVMMLTGPIAATRQILERNALTLDDLDVIEVNEAFASVVLAWAHDLKSDLSNVNVNGGAIALGHPLGATGCVLITKCLAELQRTGGRYGLVTMCVGGGMGTATLIERL